MRVGTGTYIGRPVPTHFISLPRTLKFVNPGSGTGALLAPSTGQRISLLLTRVAAQKWFGGLADFPFFAEHVEDLLLTLKCCFRGENGITGF